MLNIKKMKGLELIKEAFALKEVERVPWVPFVGVHGGYLTDIDAETYLKSSDEVVKGISKAIEEYRPDGVPVVFDLQIEAEILGCELQWAPHNPPAVVSHPLALGKNLSELSIPKVTDGRIPVAVEAAKILREKYPDVALYGLITGPFTLALHLMGTLTYPKKAYLQILSRHVMDRDDANPLKREIRFENIIKPEFVVRVIVGYL